MEKGKLGKGEISVSKLAKTDKLRFGVVSEEEEIKAEGRIKFPGEEYIPASPDSTRKRKKGRARLSEKLEVFGKMIYRKVKKIPKTKFDKLVRGGVSKREKVIEYPLRVSGPGIYPLQPGVYKRVSWISIPRSSVNRRRILVTASPGSGKDGFVIDAIAGKRGDISLFRTIISAIIKGHIRDRKPLIRYDDLKIAVKKTYSRLIILVVLDTSTSMKYMLPWLIRAIIKLKLLAWRKRDKVGLIVCSGKEAEVLVYPTTNINIIMRKFRYIKLGGSTPLADGMLKALYIIKRERLRNPDIMPLVVLISDGLANIPLKREIPEGIYDICPIRGFADTIYMAKLYRRERIPTIVINPLHEPGAQMVYGWNPTKLLHIISRITKGIYIGIPPRMPAQDYKKILESIFSAINSLGRLYR